MKKLLISILSIVALIMSVFTASAADTGKTLAATGDETNVFLIIAILVAAVAVAIVVVVLGKKNNK
ncbi:MAG: LPXTG cell wall anchor domain-containing protein [Acutalibacteraceae bacterium]